MILSRVLALLLYGVVSNSSQTADRIHVNKDFGDRLNQEEKNAMCCAKNMRCCKKPTNLSSVEIRAVLVRCPNVQCEAGVISRSMKQPVTYTSEHNIRYFPGFDEDEPLAQSEVTKCHKKLLITIKIKGSGPNTCNDQFIVLDHVYDPVSEKRTRLLNPYVIKIRNEQITQTYKLKSQHMVNSEAKEVVYNKHDGNYTGCDTTSSKPTCRAVKYKGKTIPYSTGFCCSCDALKNAQRQPQSTSANGPIVSYSDPAFLLDGVECPRNLAGSESRQPILHYMATEPAHTTKEFNQGPASNGYNVKQRPLFGSNAINDYNKGFKAVTVLMVDEIFGATDSGNNFSNRNISANVNKWGYTHRNFHDSAQNQLLPHVNISHERTELPLLKPRNGFIKPSKKWQPLMWYGAKNNINQPLNQELYRYKRNVDFNENENQPPDALNIKTDNDFGAKVHDLKQMLSEEIKSDGVSSEEHLQSKRQVSSSGTQRRGGQNCADRYTPPKLHPDTYHESTHCLRFSDLWYTVYQLQQPILEQIVHIQIFEKREDHEGRTRWRDLTKGNVIKVGTFQPHFKDQQGTVSINYDAKDVKPEEGLYALNYKTARLLVPDGVANTDINKYREVKAGPEEYLVVHPSQVSFDGDQCNVAGVGFEGFFKQPNRCSVPRGSCLANQPTNLWRHDHEAEKRGKRGCFFLKHYGELPKDPIRKNVTTGEQYLAMQYTGKHSSIINMEVKADFNAVLRPQSSAKITEVYVDSTNPTKTHLTVKITNSGLTSSYFSASLTDCPLDMPAAINSIKSKSVLIPPQHQHIFKLEIRFTLPADRFHCSIEALNSKKELVALRRIRIQKSDRCICTWHCLCACVGSIEGLKCKLMSLEHYHAAGFQGSLPVTTTIVQYTFLDDILSFIIYIMLFVLLTLLIMGFTKAIVGCCLCPPIAAWGLDVLLDMPLKSDKYREQPLCCRNLEYDSDSWPIHSASRRKVRSVSKSTEFCMNVIFFFTYPLSVFYLLLKRLCCSYYTYERDNERCYEEIRTVRVAKVPSHTTKGKWEKKVTTRKMHSSSEGTDAADIISFEETTSEKENKKASREGDK